MTKTQKVTIRMNIAHRMILVIGSIGILHSSMVPPVSQVNGSSCRYHEFVERSLFFTKEYGINHGDMVALISEYGIIISITVIAYLISGFFIKKNN